jgi:hypothetical protein
VVSVPGLSKTTASTRASVSRARPPLSSTPALAAAHMLLLTDSRAGYLTEQTKSIDATEAVRAKSRVSA